MGGVKVQSGWEIVKDKSKLMIEMMLVVLYS